MYHFKPEYVPDEEDRHPKEVDGQPSVCAYCSKRRLMPSQIVNLVGRYWRCINQIPRNELRTECEYYEREPGCDDDTPAPAPVVTVRAPAPQCAPLVEWLWEIKDTDTDRTRVCHELIAMAEARKRFGDRLIRRLEDTRHVNGQPDVTTEVLDPQMS